MKLAITREPSTDAGTFGKAVLYDGANAVGRWYSLELPWRDNQHAISCIPTGTYTADLIESPHFQRSVYRLSGVPDRSSIEIHPANWGGDTSLGYYSDLRGCLAVGRGLTFLPRPSDGITQKAISSSTAALNELIALAGNHIDVEIT